MVNVLVNGPASWNMLVDLDRAAEDLPHTVIARTWLELGRTLAGRLTARTVRSGRATCPLTRRPW